MRRITASGVVFVLALAGFVGCGSSDERHLVPVSGIVTLDGKPLEGASVNYISDEFKTSGLTDAEGKYELRAVPGDYKVFISKSEGGTALVKTTDDPLFGMEEFEAGSPDAKAPNAPKQIVPDRYSNPAATTLKITVPPDGTSAADFTNLVSN